MVEFLLGVKDACSCCLSQSELLYNASLGVRLQPSPENILESCFRIKIVHAPGDVVMVCEQCKNRLMHSWDLLVTVRDTQKRFDVRDLTNVEVPLDNVKIELQETSGDVPLLRTEPDSVFSRSDVNSETSLKILKDSEDQNKLSDVRLDTTRVEYTRKNYHVEKPHLGHDNDVLKCKRPAENKGNSSLGCVPHRKSNENLGSLEGRHDVQSNIVISQPTDKLTASKESSEVGSDRSDDCAVRLMSERDLHSWLLGQFYKDELKCPICKEPFKIYHRLSSHMSEHFPNYECHDCGKRCAFKKSMVSHVKIHSGPVTCRVCGKRFLRGEYMRRHVRTAHMNVPSVVRCPRCPEVFVTDWSKVKHLAEVHDDHTRRHTCTVCSRSFNSAGSLGTHKRRTHLRQRDSLCNVCGAKFYSASDLRYHMRTHTGEMKYSCGVCGKSFTKKWGLTGHLRIHNGDKPYQCDVCERRFTQKSTLVGHLKTHDRKRNM